MFRGRGGSSIKALWHDGIGLSLYAKRLDRGHFVWPVTVASPDSIPDYFTWYFPLKGCTCLATLFGAKTNVSVWSFVEAIQSV